MEEIPEQEVFFALDSPRTMGCHNGNARHEQTFIAGEETLDYTGSLQSQLSEGHPGGNCLLARECADLFDPPASLILFSVESSRIS